jgi:nucleotide-binding universal stress UspA family protein
VSQSVVNTAKCSVRIARGRLDEPGLPVRILIGIDASEASREAVREVARRQWPTGTEVKLVAVDDPMTPTLIGRLIPAVARTVNESNREELRSTEEELEQCALLLNGDALTVSTIIRDGEAKRLLVQLSEEWRADCLFVGATGVRNRLERFVLGSTSAAVAAEAHCSVEIVKQSKG